MSIITFVPSTTILSADVNANTTGLSDGTLDTANNSMATFRGETGVNYVSAGLVWTLSSGLIGAMTAGVCYVNGVRLAPSSIASHTFTASKDTYVDINTSGTLFYVEVANNAGAPALTANAIRIAKVVTSGSAIVQVLQGAFNTSPVSPNTLNWFGFDSLGNPVYNTNPANTKLGYAHVIAQQTGITTVTDVTGLSTTVIVPAGRRIKITGFTPQVLSTITTDRGDFSIREGSTTLNTAFATTGQGGWAGSVIAELTPTAGSHTYKLSLARGLGTGSLTIYSDGSGNQTLISVELV